MDNEFPGKKIIEEDVQKLNLYIYFLDIYKWKSTKKYCAIFS